MTDRLRPGARIGILGGGQLGRMLSLAAARLGFSCTIFEPAPNCPAAQVAAGCFTAEYTDIDALHEFARSVDVVTYEFENVPEAALDAIETIVPIRPNRKSLRTSQDRLVEKDFLNDVGLTTAAYRDIASPDDLAKAMADIGPNGILKSRRFGYDGKGQLRVNAETNPESAFAAMNGAASILEGLVPFTKEISVIAARGTDGAISCFDPGENVHKDGILATTTVPASISLAQATDAVLMAGRIVNALDYVGVMGIELFVTPAGLIVNEIAPRVHNSGHWTQNACTVDQFEQHIRAIAGWPLAAGRRHSDAVMTNLIGDEVTQWADVVDDGLHLYGKAETRPGRKMGHINRIAPLATK